MFVCEDFSYIFFHFKETSIDEAKAVMSNIKRDKETAEELLTQLDHGTVPCVHV